MAVLNNTQSVSTPYANAINNYGNWGNVDATNFVSNPPKYAPNNLQQSTTQTYGDWKPFNLNNYTYKPHTNQWGNEGGQYLDENGNVVMQTMGANNTNTLMNNFQGPTSNGLREQYPNRTFGRQANYFGNYNQNSNSPMADMLRRLFGNNNYGMQGGKNER